MRTAAWYAKHEWVVTPAEETQLLRLIEAVAATMADTMVAAMKVPIFSGLFVIVLVQTETAHVIAIAVIVGMLATARMSMTSTRV